MRETSSDHSVSIRTYCANKSRYPASAFRPNLNLPHFSKLLHNTTINDGASSGTSSHKRKAVDPALSIRRAKRTKTSRGSHDYDDESSESDSVNPFVGQDYPKLVVFRKAKGVNEVVPILRHVLNIQYTKQDEHRAGLKQPDVETFQAWDNEDTYLQKVLYALSEPLTSRRTIDLGKVRFGEFDGGAVGVSQADQNTWLFRVPSLFVDGESNDLRETTSRDLLLASLSLQDLGLAHVDALLRVVIYPPDNNLTLPFTLQLEFVASLILPPALDRNLHGASNRKSLLAREDAQRRLLRAAYLPHDVISENVNNPINISSLYSILGAAQPVSSKEADIAMQPRALIPTLLPFQRRSVAWMLSKEGMTVSADGSIVPHSSSNGFSFWEEIKEGEHVWYMNRLSGELSEHRPDVPVALGGILAEEPGLGKTVETIALILLSPAPPEYNPTMSWWDPDASLEIKAVKTTLIVTPPSLASQWKEELEAHAPSLKVLIYEGWSKVKVPITKNDVALHRLSQIKLDDKKAKRRRSKSTGKRKAVYDESDTDDEYAQPDSSNDDGDALDWCNYVHGYDVVITTYQTLRSDFNVALPAPKRPRRADVTYATEERPRSPLVMVEWRRVVMDEVQMVGGGKAEEMVSLIPRLSSFAVSGTPAKANIADLIHVLKFLRVDKVVGSPRLWERLLKSGFTEDFTAFLQHYAIRTIKSEITTELTIPQQTRYLVGIELGKVERHVYDQTLEAILLGLGLDARGVAASTGWQVDSTILRSSIRRLRGICTHPQVGQLQRKGDGLYKPGALKTMDAVLATMREQNWRNLMEEWKSKIQSLVRYAQLQQQDGSNGARYQHTLKTLQSAETETHKHSQEIQSALAKHDIKGKAMKEEASLLRQTRDISIDPTDNKGKGKYRERTEDSESEDGDDPEEDDLPKTPAGEEHRAKRRAIKQRLREAQLLLHRVKFLQGDVHHVLGNAPEEDAAYQAAENLRRDLLRATEEDAKNAVVLLRDNASKKGLSHDELLIGLPLLGQGGVRYADLMDEVNTLIEDVLNEQSDLIWEWRERIVSLLTQGLTPGEDQADGEEYQRTLEDQGEAETYLQAYAALLADRRVALVNERTLLAAHDDREKHLRRTKAALNATLFTEEDGIEMPEGLNMKPEHEVLHKELSDRRKDILSELQGRAIKSILVDLNAASARILQKSTPEKIILLDAVEIIRRLISDQNTLQDKLDADLALLRRAFNQRIVYFRQLQEISDSVAEAEWEEESLIAALQACELDRAGLEAKINTTRARQRYLDNLVSNQDDEAVDDDDKACILCRCEFTRGYITQCAHVFCELCMKAWLQRKEGKTCPVCRVPVNSDTTQRFTVNSVDMEPPPKLVAGEPAPQSSRKIFYNMIVSDSSVFADIQNMETYGDFGSKIQTLVRHLLFLKLTDPGAKSIVFSAWADSLHIVEWALQRNGIRCLRIDQKSKNESAPHKFRTDPEILALLLHGERENAGLNLTCASRVFLLESVVQHSFEIQAIARIDRLGQTRPTEVYCYYAEDTIERNILDLASRKGLSLYTQENSVGTLNVSPFSEDNSKTIDDPQRKKALQKGDFIHKVDDMLAILFPHMYEDLEYLLPPVAVVPDVSLVDEDVEMRNVEPSQRISRGVEKNAIAGPSRLS
ncbi:SNF2 family N-terminal domain-containing protein [Crassisporium funariophilum]|nr:SNF2 family N-terminal domain-containing protein [Crassisporium funariophilum]